MPVIVTGLPAALEEFSETRIAAGFRAGVAELGAAVALEAELLLAAHRYSGRLEAGIATHVSGDSIAAVTAQIGVSDREIPEAGPIAYGWRSHSGAQPPADALGAWAAAKGIGGGMAPNRLGFVLARAIRQHGYVFAPIRPFERAWQAVGPRAAEIIGAAIGRQRA